MGAAIWSSSLAQMEDFEFRFFVQFFHNHGLLNIADRPQWYVIPNGSRSYLAPLCEPFKNNIRLNANISGISRVNGCVQIEFNHSDSETFDEVVIACHSDEALSLLNDASPEESRILSAMPYSENSVVLHTDKKLLPKRKKAWASWHVNVGGNETSVCTANYYMNLLQSLDVSTPVIVSLNQSDLIDEEKILQSHSYWHPVYDENTSATQEVLSQIQGMNNTYYCGAYNGWGFHEDGAKSGVLAAEMLIELAQQGKKVA